MRLIARPLPQVQVVMHRSTHTSPGMEETLKCVILRSAIADLSLVGKEHKVR